jgi:Domain of unknown function (DUF5069)
MTTDFRDGKTFPRRGRESIGAALWLARVSDKARAAANGTIHDYIYPCPIDLGMMERWGVTSADFDAAIRSYATDAALLEWLLARTTPQKIQAANAWLLKEQLENLERQDAEEGAGTAA